MRRKRGWECQAVSQGHVNSLAACRELGSDAGSGCAEDLDMTLTKQGFCDSADTPKGEEGLWYPDLVALDLCWGPRL